MESVVWISCTPRNHVPDLSSLFSVNSNPDRQLHLIREESLKCSTKKSYPTLHYLLTRQVRLKDIRHPEYFMTPLLESMYLSIHFPLPVAHCPLPIARCPSVVSPAANAQCQYRFIVCISSTKWRKRLVIVIFAPVRYGS
jgi:hypothetical protein